jgi:hypothetical protein
MTIGQSTLTITTWKNNHFIFNDAQNAFVLMVSASLYFMFILIHNLFSLKFSSNSPTIQIFNFSENFLNENYMKKFSQNKNIKTSLVRSLLWIVFFILFVIIIFQNKFGWGVHGLPFYRENMFRLAGSSVYLRDFLLPGIIIVFLLLLPKINFLEKLILLIFSIVMPATSFSKVTILIYFFVLVFAFFHGKLSKLANKNYFLHKNLILNISLLLWLVFVYTIIMVGREKLIYVGEPIYNQLFFIINFDIISSYEKYLDFLQLKHLFSMSERFLGFKELASVFYYKENIFFEANLLSLIGIGDFSNLTTNSPREFTSNYSRGGVGVDWISSLVMTGYFMIIPIFLISLLFLIQILLTKTVPKKIEVAVETILMLVFIRFAIDGNMIIIKWYLIMLAFILLTICSLKKIAKF